MDTFSQVFLVLLCFFFIFIRSRFGASIFKNDICINYFIGCPSPPLSYSQVRRRWLYSFYIYKLIQFSVVYLTYSYKYLEKLFISYGTPLSIFILFLISVFRMMPGFWITYHCAYKKQGIICLFFIMIFRVLDVLWLFFLSLEWSSFNKVILQFILPACIPIFYLRNCYRLYRLNCNLEVNRVNVD